MWDRKCNTGGNIVLKGCGLTEIHVIGNKARNLKIHQELIVHMLLSAILELSENVWLCNDCGDVCTEEDVQA